MCPVDINLFASAINHKLDKFVLWKQDPITLISDVSNYLPNNASRILYNPRTGWALKQSVFDDIVKTLGLVDIDLFASIVNHKL